jgi:Subtilase family
METREEQAAVRALLPDREKIMHDFDGDGWDDIWVMLEIKIRKFDKLGILQRPNDDDDGDGFTNREEMLLHRSPMRRELVPTPLELARQLEAAKVYAEKSNREHLAAILPQIEAGLEAAQAAKPAVVSEEEAAPEAKKQRLLNVAEALLNEEEGRKKTAVKGLSKEAKEALADPAAGLMVTGVSGGLLELVGPDNLVSAQTMATSAVWPGGASTAPDLTGAGQQIGIWEAGGGVLARHTEFLLPDGSSRVAQVDNPAAELDGGPLGAANLGIFNSHATQVAGVLAAAGNTGTAKGMAFQADLAAYGSAGDIAEMMAAAASGMKISNHSYSARFGWIFLSGAWYWLGGTAVGEDPRFGLYQRQSREIDIVGYENPRYLSLWSSGNEGAELGPVNTSGVIPVGTSYFRIHDDDADGFFTVGPTSTTTTHPSDSSAPLSGATAAIYAAHLSTLTVPVFVPGGIGVDTLKSSGVAKNNLSVGAINDIPTGYTVPSSAVVSSFSSRGPTDDGRVKPDLVADGTSFVSTHFVLGTPQPVANFSFETPALSIGGSANGSTNWNEDSPGSGSAQTARFASFAAEALQVLRLNTANYRVWQDLTSVSLAANTQYVLSAGLGKLTGTTPDTNQVKVSVYTNGFSNLLAAQTFSPGKLAALTNNAGTFGTFQMGFLIGATVPSGTVRVVIENLGGGVAFADWVRLNVASTNIYTNGAATAENAPVSGTSFSTPSVTGSLALLQQENAGFGNAPLLASTWKALLVTTADDGDRLPSYYADTTGGSPNLYPGPDYFYGWGLMNTRRAAETLDQNQRTASHRTHLREHTLFNGNTVEVLVEVGANMPRLQPTLSWTDPAYQSSNSASTMDENLPAVTVDSTAAVLINDLDLKVVRPEGGAAIEAWKLNPSTPRAAATRGDNTVDNVEQATVLPLTGSYLTHGTYKLQITHKGSLRRAQQTSNSPLRYQLLTGEYQKFSLAIIGNMERSSDLLRVTTVDRAVTPSNVLVPLTWSSDKGLRYRVQRSLDLLTWTDVPGDITATGSTSITTIIEALGINRLFYRVKEVNP